MRGFSSGVLALVLAAPSVRAQQTTANDSARAIDPVIVTASRREERRTSSIVSAAVISRADIAATGASDVASVLLQQAGVQTAGGAPVGSSVYIQGLGDQRVLILLDGEPLVGRIGGAFDLSRLPTTAIERIEVVQGPQSVLYGSDAIGGVVNIITRRPPRGTHSIVDGAEASATVGSHGRVDLSAGLAAAASERVSYRLDLSRRDIDLTPGFTGDRSTYARRWDVAPVVRWSPSTTVDVEAGGLGTLEIQRYRAGQLYQFSDNTQVGAHAGASIRAGMQRFTPRVSVSTFNHLSRAALTARPVSDSGARDVQRLATAELGYSAVLSQLVIDAGTELRHESILADRVDGRDRSFDGAALYGQATWGSGRVSLLPGARVTWNDAWGTNASPRLALLVRPFADAPLAWRAAVGRGFRAPDFKELYMSFINASAGYSVTGNPELRPEHSVNWSSSLEWTGLGLEARASVFLNRFDDFIETTGPTAAGEYTYSNVAHGSTRGIGLEANRVLGTATLSASYDYLSTRDDATGGPLLGRAPHTARATLTVTPFGVRASATALYTGRAPAARGEDGMISASRDAFTQFNVRAARRLPGLTGAELAIGSDNVFDARAGAGWPGFTGRQVYVSLGWSGR